MTAVDSTVTPVLKLPVRARAVAWLGHLVIPAIAVLSLATGRFYLWVDLRLLGPGAIFFEVLWMLSVLVIPFALGPQLAGVFWKRRWVTPPDAAWTRVLFWPTYVMLACLWANVVWYCLLAFQRRADVMVPAPLVAMVVLLAWVWGIRRWRAAKPQREMPARGAGAFGSVAFGLLGTAVLAGIFFMYSFSRPPAAGQRADIAVVLGGRVNEDGMPSIALRERVLAAVRLYKEGRVDRILLSGGMVQAKRNGPELSEVLGMQKVCIEAGVPVEAISLDPVGINTKTTALNTLQFMQAGHLESVIICTSDFHLYRTLWCFRRVGVDATAVAAAPEEWRCANPVETFRELMGNVVYQLIPTYREPKAVVMNMQHPRVVVYKKKGSLELYDGKSLVKTFTCLSGRNEGDKDIEGDGRTPLGTFHIVFKNPQSSYHLSLGLDYPNAEDAKRGLTAGLISAAEHQQILAALKTDLSKEENQKNLWYTKLGGEIFLHGEVKGRTGTGTAGCVALANKDIEELYAVLPLGTEVEIVP